MFAIDSSTAFDGVNDPDGSLSSLQAVRSMSAASLARFVDSEGSRQFSGAIYWRAFKRTFHVKERLGRDSSVQTPSFG